MVVDCAVTMGVICSYSGSELCGCLSCNFYSLVRDSVVIRGATEQSTLAERGKFHENSIPILRVDYSCVYNNLLKRLRFLGNKK